MKLITSIIFVLVLVLGFLLGTLVVEPEIKLSCPQPVCPQPVCPTLKPIVVKESCKCQDISVFKQMANGLVAEKEYVANKYDCTQYSKELSRRYKDEGWNAKVIQTVVDCDSGLLDKDSCNQFEGRHDIVKVDTIYVEATGGLIISPKDYKGYGLI